MNHAFFVTYGGGHVQMTIPVVKEIQRRGWKVTVLGLTTARKPLAQAGIPFIGYKELLTRQDSLALSYGEILAKKMHNVTSTISLDESIAYLGLSFAELVQQVGEKEAWQQVQTQGRHAFLPIELMKNVLNKYKPDIVVTTNSPRTEQAAIMAANDMGIPSLTMLDLFGLSELASLESPNLCVLSEAAKQNLVNTGIAAERISVTGNPAFDTIAKAKSQHTKSDSTKKSILWLDQPSYWLLSQNHHHIRPDEEVREHLQLLYEICRGLKAKLLIRAHPSQNTKTIENMCEGFDSQHYQLVHCLELYPLLMSVDVVLSYTSTASLEAAMLGTPLVNIRPDTKTDMPLPEYGCALAARNYDEVTEQLKRLLNEPKLCEQLRKSALQFNCDGQAAMRVADKITEILNGTEIKHE